MLQGKTAIVTGATSGIGKVTALELARMGATVVLLVRSRSKGEQAQAEIKAQTGNQSVDLMIADFASLDSVRRGVASFLQRYNQLHILVNNAGLYVPKRLVSQEGYEMTFAVNHLGPFLLTNLLLDTLKASAPARVVNVASMAHLTGAINFDDLQSTRRYNGSVVYGNTKLANVLFSYALARRLEGSGVTSNSLHPGVIASNFGVTSNDWYGLFFRIARPFLRTAEQGAETSIYLASSPEVEGVNGQYFVKKRPRPSSPTSNKIDLQERLWEVSAKLVGLNNES